MSTSITEGVRVISVFNVKAEDQDKVVDMLIRTSKEMVSKQPGFLAATINKSYDGRRVAILSRWASRDAFEAAFKRPEVVEYIRRNLDIAQADWHVYDVVYRATGGDE